MIFLPIILIRTSFFPSLFLSLFIFFSLLLSYFFPFSSIFPERFFRPTRTAVGTGHAHQRTNTRAHTVESHYFSMCCLPYLMHVDILFREALRVDPRVDTTAWGTEEKSVERNDVTNCIIISTNPLEITYGSVM